MERNTNLYLSLRDQCAIHLPKLLHHLFRHPARHRLWVRDRHPVDPGTGHVVAGAGGGCVGGQPRRGAGGDEPALAGLDGSGRPTALDDGFRPGLPLDRGRAGRDGGGETCGTGRALGAAADGRTGFAAVGVIADIEAKGR